MIFNFLLFAAVGMIAYFHYAQGLFSALLSAIFVVFAAVLAVGYHESLGAVIAGAGFPEQAAALSLILIFVVTYVTLRLVFDRAVSGNVRFPVAVDKGGAAVMGLIAGVFATGVIALAAQTLPFGPSVAGFSRQALEDPGDFAVPGASKTGSALDSTLQNIVTSRTLDDPDHANHLWLRQDEAVVGLTRRLSEGGALAGNVALSDIHPDYLAELFGQRVGIQSAALHTANNLGKSAPVNVTAGYDLPSLPPVIDAELDVIRKKEGDGKLDRIPQPDASHHLVVLQVTFGTSKDLADSDQYVRLAPGSVRLKAGKQNYYPVGTFAGPVLLQNRIDDPLLIDVKGGESKVDFAFVVDAGDALTADPTSQDKLPRFKEGSFLEVKRYARLDVAGLPLLSARPAAAITAEDLLSHKIGGVLRKTAVAAAAQKASPTAAPATAEAPVTPAAK